MASEAEGTFESELGFAKTGAQWHLVVREARYERVNDGDPNARLFFDATMRVQHLLECSREMRINALRLFPLLAQEMREEAANALETIQDAKKFVAPAVPFSAVAEAAAELARTHPKK